MCVELTGGPPVRWFVIITVFSDVLYALTAVIFNDSYKQITLAG